MNNEKGIIIEKQKLSDIQRLINTNVNNFLVLIEEGAPKQVDLAKQKARMDLIKFGPDMQKIAEKMGEIYSDAVHAYLESVDSIVHSTQNMIDHAQISHCFQMSQNLERQLRAA